MTERVQVIFRWDREKLAQLKAWADKERLTLQETLEALATQFLSCPDSSLITGDNKTISTDSSTMADVIARLKQLEQEVSHLVSVQERVADLETKLGEFST